MKASRLLGRFVDPAARPIPRRGREVPHLRDIEPGEYAFVPPYTVRFRASDHAVVIDTGCLAFGRGTAGYVLVEMLVDRSLAATVPHGLHPRTVGGDSESMRNRVEVAYPFRFSLSHRHRQGLEVPAQLRPPAGLDPLES